MKKWFFVYVYTLKVKQVSEHMHVKFYFSPSHVSHLAKRYGHPNTPII